MATVEETLVARLLATSTITALVADRVSPQLNDQDSTMPAITYSRISSTRFPAMHSDPSLVKARFQVDVWSSRYDEAVYLAAQVRSALQRYRTSTGLIIQDTFIISETDLYEDEPKQHHIAIDIEINYSE